MDPDMDPDNTDFQGSANDVGGVGDTLRPMEALDADDVRNDDGDEVVDPPDHWSEADRSDTAPRAEGGGETLDEKLAAEVPEPSAEDTSEQMGDTELLADDDVDRLLPEDHGTDEGQVSGTPEDGGSLFPVVE
jgi:hypothetical protein